MSSSPFPILDNRPIDKWKVTELKEELKRRRLTTQGLKFDLVRRLDDALRAEQEESANQQPDVTYVPAANLAPDPTQTTPEPIGVQTTPPPVFSKPEVTQEASNERIVEMENKETFSGLDSKAQPTEVSAIHNQVSEVIPVTGFEVKSDCISSNNEKIELKGNEIADNFKLEHSLSKSQEPSTAIGESHPKISAGGGDDADMTKGNNNSVDSEKLNLDRFSGDESMDDEPETKQNESVTSLQVVDKSEQNDLLPDKADNMDGEKGEAPDNKSLPLVASDKRKLPVNGKAFSFFLFPFSFVNHFCFLCLIFCVGL